MSRSDDDDPGTTLPLSRRELLGLGATAAAGFGVLRLIAEPARAQDTDPTTPPEGPILPGSGFGVEIDGAPAAGAAVRAVEIDSLPFKRRPRVGLLAQPGYARLVTAGSPEGAAELQTWFDECARGKNIRKNITVTLFRADGSSGRQYDLFNCYPTQWSSVNFDTSSTVQTETLTVKIGRIEFKT